MNTVKSFIKEVVARVAGDSAEILAQKNYRKACSAIKSQISLLEAKQVDDEVAVDTAKENLEAAKYPTTLITDNAAYVRGISSAYDKLNAAEMALGDTVRSIAFFDKLLADYDKEI